VYEKLKIKFVVYKKKAKKVKIMGRKSDRGNIKRLDPPEEERRKYLRTVGGLVVGLAVGGVVGWLSKPAEVVEALGPTVTKTLTQTVTVPVTVPITITPTPVFKKGGTLQIGVEGDVKTLDPNKSTGFSSRVMANIHDSLFVRDVNGVPGVPAAALLFVKVSNSEWIVRLRDDAKWHCGDRFDAYTALESINWGLDPAHPAAEISLWPPVQEVKVVDDYTLRFLLKRPYSMFVSALSATWLSLGHLKCREKYGEDFGTKATCGTGAWMFNELKGIGEWVRGKYVKFARNPDYYGLALAEGGGAYKWGPPALDYIQFNIIPEAATIAAALHKGELEFHPRAPVTYVEDLKGDTNLNIVKKVQLRTLCIDVNSKKFPTTLKEFRFAVYYAIDTVKIVNTMLKYAGIPADNVLNAQAYGYVPMGFNEYNPDKAKELLRTINWDTIGKDIGYKIVLLYSIVRDPLNPELCEAVKGYLEAVGIKVELMGLEHAAYMAEGEVRPYEDRKYHLMLLGWSQFDADHVTGLRFHSSTRNYCAQTDADLDKLIEDQVATEDPEEQKKIFQRVQEILTKERCYTIPVYDAIWWYCWNKKVHNVKPIATEFQAMLYTDFWKD